MNDRFQMSDLPTEFYTQCHFFAGIGAGASRFDSRGGLTTDPSGPAVALSAFQRRRPRGRDC